MAGIDISKLNKPKVDTSKATGKSLFERDIKLGSGGANDRFRENFFLQIATMLEAGMDLRAVLELVQKENKKASLKELVGTVLNKVVRGASFWEALRDSNKFSAYEYYSIQIGEETGKLQGVSYELAAYYTRRIKQKRQFVSALSYPVVILVVSVLAVGFMLGFIVPMFTDVFKRFGGELPYITRLLVSIANQLTTNFHIIIIAFTAISVGLYFLIKIDKVRNSLSQAIIKVPIIGSLIKAIYLARFCTSLSLLLGSKVALLEALKLVRQMVNFYPVSSPIEKIERDILQGVQLHEALGKFNIYDSQFIALIKVGEEVNKLDSFLARLANRYSDLVEQRTQLLNTFLEPLMIVFLGGMIGLILVAMYLPMFQLSTEIL